MTSIEKTHEAIRKLLAPCPDREEEFRGAIVDAFAGTILRQAGRDNAAGPTSKAVKLKARKLASDILRVERSAKEFGKFTHFVGLTGDWTSFLPALVEVRKRAEKVANTKSPLPKPDASRRREAEREADNLISQFPFKSDQGGKKRGKLIELLYGGPLPKRHERSDKGTKRGSR
ncbi:hypothetical protein [Mesorhizobium sp. M0522]|uniref:hypothetical protein n=1 Tax=Mesorhizobium sp. M0522 TaxID=2956958 RepID=UPI0033396081